MADQPEDFYDRMRFARIAGGGLDGRAVTGKRAGVGASVALFRCLNGIEANHLIAAE